MAGRARHASYLGWAGQRRAGLGCTHAWDLAACMVSWPAQERLRCGQSWALAARIMYILTGLDTYRTGRVTSYMGQAELGWAAPMVQGAQNASSLGWGELAQDARTAGSAQHGSYLGKAELNRAAPAAGYAQQASYLYWAGQIWVGLGALVPDGAQHASSLGGAGLGPVRTNA